MELRATGAGPVHCCSCGANRGARPPPWQCCPLLPSFASLVVASCPCPHVALSTCVCARLQRVCASSEGVLSVATSALQLIRAIGESKSKSEEDAIVAKLVELSKAKIREGRREARTQKELLVYLIYIEMLGHDTAWAQAAAIQLCSDKNLAVKKVGGGWHRGPEKYTAGLSCTVSRASSTARAAAVAQASMPAQPSLACGEALRPPHPTPPLRLQLAYLAVSLLLEPSSELAIMVVATIQADLRSDNFLTGRQPVARVQGRTGT